jgi:hypothetical protein
MPTEELQDDVDEKLDEDALDEDALDKGDDDGATEGGDDDDDDDESAPTAVQAKKDQHVEDEDVPDPDDVEDDLDTILKDRISADDDIDDEDDDDHSTGKRLPPKGEAEFVCKSCFLVKGVSQRVDEANGLCGDCV